MLIHDYPYKNLVFEGGGVKGVAYGGVFEVLEQRQITPQIESVAGTSAGAITATMMSLNYSAEEFLKIMMTLNFEKFEDGCDLIGPIRLIRHFGWFKGNYFLNLMESFIEKKTGDGQKPGMGARRSGIWSRSIGTDTSKDYMSSAPT